MCENVIIPCPILCFHTLDTVGTVGKYLTFMKNSFFLLSDPEATESSSGGESADEADWAAGGAGVGVEGGTPAARYAPIHERAKYRWLQKVQKPHSQFVSRDRSYRELRIFLS